MYGDKAVALIERLEQSTWLPPYDDTLREVLTEIDELHTAATDWLQYGGPPCRVMHEALLTGSRAQETYRGVG
jgi:hypothetical protein